MKDLIVNKKASMMCTMAVILGVVLNLACAVPVSKLGFPVYIDTIGTITVACLCGYFPGIMTGVATNIVMSFSDAYSPYYAILSGLIAVTVTSFYYKKLLDKFSGRVLLVITLAFIGGVPGAGVSWILYHSVDNQYTLNLMAWFQENLHLGFFASDAAACFAYDIIDKAISVTAALLIIRFLPESIKSKLRYSGLHQEYVPEEVRKISNEKSGHSLKRGTLTVIAIVTIAAVVSLTWVGYMVYGRLARNEATEDAQNTINYIIEFVNPDDLSDCMRNGKESPAYTSVEHILRMSLNYTAKMSHLYIFEPQKKGMKIVFDIESDVGHNNYSTAHENGTVLETSEEFRLIYEKIGREEDIIGEELKTYRGWTWSVMKYYPLPSGEKLYVGGDIDMTDIREYQNDFLIRVLIITGALLMVTLAFGLRMANNRLILPLNSLTYCTDAFVFDSSKEHQDDEVRQMMRLKINTGDEIEKLYSALKKMTMDSIEHERNIRQQAQTIAEMQSGLILILADMVENRDCDTGNHTKRTAYYVRIIMEGLKKKGYYLDELTDSFISDVTQSAPLHDIGKIGISDTILNKPGKLTEEEFNEMKRHTIIGRDLMDRAISEIHGESYLYEAKNLAAYHHEKWNGKGYPEGLAGEDIPLSARIMAIADVFDAVSQKRVYKEAFSFEQSVAIIEEDSGISFDPKCVEAFMENLDEIWAVLEGDMDEEFAV